MTVCENCGAVIEWRPVPSPKVCPDLKDPGAWFHRFAWFHKFNNSRWCPLVGEPGTFFLCQAKL